VVGRLLELVASTLRLAISCGLPAPPQDKIVWMAGHPAGLTDRPDVAAARVRPRGG